jgi:hypothetical protein
LSCWVGVHCDIYKSSYNISTISYLNLPPPSFFIPSSPHSWNSFSRSHFSIYIQVYTVFALYSPSHTLSLSLPPLTGTKPPGRTCSTILFSSFVKENKWYFYLFKIATQGVSLWHFHVFISELVPLLCFSSFYLIPLLILVSTGLKILYSFLYREYINYIRLLNFLPLPSPSLM